jgi:hypothetical protein
LINLMQEYSATFGDEPRLISGLENGLSEHVWDAFGSDWDTLRSAWYRFFSTGVERSADAPDGFSSREGQVEKVVDDFGATFRGDFP